LVVQLSGDVRPLRFARRIHAGGQSPKLALGFPQPVLNGERLGHVPPHAFNGDQRSRAVVGRVVAVLDADDTPVRVNPAEHDRVGEFLGMPAHRDGLLAIVRMDGLLGQARVVVKLLRRVPRDRERRRADVFHLERTQPVSVKQILPILHQPLESRRLTPATRRRSVTWLTFTHGVGAVSIRAEPLASDYVGQTLTFPPRLSDERGHTQPGHGEDTKQRVTAEVGSVLLDKNLAQPYDRTDLTGPNMSNAVEPLVLVVDDEEPIRQLERRILESGGYRVIEASRALEAFALLQKDLQVDLVIADLQMPDLGGEEMARRIRRDRPDIRVLYVTGHIDELMDERSTLWEGEAFLDKPFTAKALLEAVSLLLYKKLPPDAQ